MADPFPPPPGWYPEPPSGQRYWDGTQWTDQRVPMRKSLLLPWWLQAALIVAVIFAVLIVFF